MATKQKYLRSRTKEPNLDLNSVEKYRPLFRNGGGIVKDSVYNYARILIESLAEAKEGRVFSPEEIYPDVSRGFVSGLADLAATSEVDSDSINSQGERYLDLLTEFVPVHLIGETLSFEPGNDENEIYLVVGRTKYLVIKRDFRGREIYQPPEWFEDFLQEKREKLDKRLEELLRRRVVGKGMINKK